MKTFTKKLGLLLVLLSAVLSVSAYDFEVDGLYYDADIESMNCTVVPGELPYSGDIVIPETVIYKNRTFYVTSINGAFKGCSSLNSVFIPTSITNIENETFKDCTSLRSITGADNVINISSGCFYGCRSLENISISQTTKIIENNAFRNCTSLCHISIPSGVISIGKYAFAGCQKLEDIKFPDNLTILSEGIIEGCEMLESLKIPNQITKIEDYAFSGCKKINKIEIPASINTIGNAVFSECINLKEVTIENGSSTLFLGYNREEKTTYKTYKYPLFENCPIESVFIGRNILSNSGYDYDDNWGCFARNESLKAVEFSENVSMIEGGAFAECSNLTSIDIPATVTTIGEYAFTTSGIKQINFEDGYLDLKLVLKVGSWEYKTPHTFSKTSITNVHLGRNIIISSRSQNPGYGGNPDMLFPKTLEKLEIGYPVSDISALLLYGQKETDSFSHFVNLKYVEFGSGLSSIPNLKDNVNLTKIALTTTTPPAASPFSNSQYMDLTLMIPEGSKGQYKDAAIWKNFWEIEERDVLLTTFEDKGIRYHITDKSSVEVIRNEQPYTGDIIIPEIAKYNDKSYHVTSIGGVFTGNPNLISISIPNTINILYQGVFKNCTSLNRITLPSTIESLPNYFAAGCTALSSIEIPLSITSIGSNSFSDCKALNNIKINNIEYLGKGSFSHCENLTAITLSNSMVNIADSVFYGCTNLLTIDGIENIRIIGDDTFNGCKKISSITIPNIYTIGNRAFANCEQISAFNMGHYLETIGDMAFLNCKNIESISIPGTAKIFGENIFSGMSTLNELRFEDSEEPLSFPIGSYDGSTDILKKNINGNTIQFKIQYYNGCFDGLPIEKLYLGRNLSNKSRYTISGDGGVDYYLITSYDAPFNNLPKLKELIIGDGVSILGPEIEKITEIDTYSTPGAFKSCPIINRVTVKAKMPPSGAEFSSTVYDNAQLIVPDETINLYKVAETWKEFTTIVEESSTGIGQDKIESKNELIRINFDGITIMAAQFATVHIYNIEGHNIFTGKVQNGEKIALASGFYIVNIDNNIIKIKI